MTARRADDNQKQIVEFLRTAGFHVFSLHRVGMGCPDLLCSYRGRWHLVEVKNGLLGWKRTDSQQKFLKASKADIVILTSIEDAQAWLKRINGREQMSHVEHLGD